MRGIEFRLAYLPFPRLVMDKNAPSLCDGLTQQKLRDLNAVLGVPKVLEICTLKWLEPALDTT